MRMTHVFGIRRGSIGVIVGGLLLIASAEQAQTCVAAHESLSGVPHFYKVDDHIYRGAQPTKLGFENLKKLGIKTDLDLRDTAERETQWEKETAGRLGMKFINVRMRGIVAPTHKQISEALSVVEDKRMWPVFVHCEGGRDRTGVVIACYRIAHDHWPNHKALEEARCDDIRSVEQAKQKYIQTYKAPSND